MSLDRRIITSHIDRVLRPRGFSRRGGGWNRRISALVEVVSLQISTIGDSFAINLGVLDVDAYALCWGEHNGEHVDEADCTVRVRLGQLATGKDRWWGASDEVTLAEVEAALVDCGLPWLEAHRTGTAMAHLLEGEASKPYPPPVFYLAAIKARAGDVRTARSLLEDLRRRTSDAWLPRIDAALSRIGREPYAEGSPGEFGALAT